MAQTRSFKVFLSAVTSDCGRARGEIARDLRGGRGLTVSVQLWRQHDARVQTWHNQREMQYPRSIAVTWQTTLDQLGGDEQTLLNLLAWYDAEPVPQSVFDPSALSASQRFKEEDGNAEDAEFAEVGGESWDEERIEAALANLADFSMIRWEAQTATVHRVVQEILRSRQEEPKRWLTAALQILNAASPTESYDVRMWPILDPLRPHLTFVAHHADETGIHEPTTRIMAVLAALLRAKALYQEAEPLMRRALAIWEQSLGPEHPSVAICLNNLAQLLQATNRLAEAEPLMRRAVDILRARFGEDHPHTQTVQDNYEALRAELPS